MLYYKLLILLILFNPLWSTAQTINGLDTVKLVNAVNDKTVWLKDYRKASLVVVIFTSNYCPYSRKYEDRIKGLQTAFKERGVQLLLVNPNSGPEDSIQEMKLKVTNEGYDFPYLSDKEQLLTGILGATRTPEAFLLKPTSAGFQILYHGALDDNPQAPDYVESPYLKLAIEAALNSEPPALDQVKVIGCIIKKG